MKIRVSVNVCWGVIMEAAAGRSTEEEEAELVETGCAVHRQVRLVVMEMYGAILVQVRTEEQREVRHAEEVTE
jgi:hypothetical protein